MPNTASAKKALRGSERKRSYNLKRKRDMHDALKSARAVASDTKGDSKTALKMAYKAIDKAAKGGTIKKNTASRKKSQIAKLLKTTA